MSNKEIKEQLQKGNAKFTIDGITSYTRGGEDNEYGDFPKVFSWFMELDSTNQEILTDWVEKNYKSFS